MKKIIFNMEFMFFMIVTIFMILIITNVCLITRNNVISSIGKQNALGLASSIIENVKSRKYDDIKTYLNEISAIGINKKIDDNIQEIIIDGKQYKEKFFGMDIPDNFIVEVIVDSTMFPYDIVKNIEVIVTYENGKNVSLDTNIQRENIEECNEPIISDVYLSNLNIKLEDYVVYPIKYDNINKQFVICNEKDNNWYNYSAKKWAKLLVINKNEENIIKAFIDEENGICKDKININNNEINLLDYVYVWIPNFTKKENASFFRYESSKNVIVNGFLYNNGKYLYLNKISDEAKDISNNCTFDGINGVWKKYGDTEDDYYKAFNTTKFAPVDIY